MADRTFDILINFLTSGGQNVSQLRKDLESVNQTASGFVGAFKVGEAIDLTGRLNAAILEIPHQLEQAIERGIEFNKVMEQSRLGIAGVLKQFDTGNYKDFRDALGDSDKVLALLREKANALGLSFESMLEQYRTTAGALFAGGVRDLQKQVDLTVLLQQAMAAIGVPEYLRQRDTIDLLEGRANRTIAGRALGISDADIQKASEAGQLYTFLTDKFQALGEAGAAIGNTFGAAEQRTKNLAQQLEGIGTKNVFGLLKSGLDSLNATLASGDTAEKIAGIGAQGAELLRDAADAAVTFAREIKSDNDALDNLLGTTRSLDTIRNAIGLNVFTRVFDTAAVQQYLDAGQRQVQNLREQIAGADTLKERAQARQALEDAIAATQQKQNQSEGEMKDAAGVVLGLLQHMDSVFDAIAGHAITTAGAMVKTAEQIERAMKAASALAKVDTDIAIQQAQLSGDDEKAFGLQKFQQTTELLKSLAKTPGISIEEATARAAALGQVLDTQHQKEIADKQASLRLDEQGIEATRLRATGETGRADALDRTTKIEQEFNRLQKDGVSDANEAWRLATVKVDSEKQISAEKHSQHATQQEITAMEREETALLRNIRGEQQLIAENPFLGADQKRDLLHEKYVEEQQALEALIQSYQAYIAAHEAAAASDPAEAEKLDGLIEKLKDAQQQYELLGFKIRESTSGGDFQSNLQNYFNSFGTSAKQNADLITGSLNSALEGTNQLLLDATFRTGNWKQTLVGVERQIAQLFLTWLEHQAEQFITGEAQKTASTASSSAQGAAIAAAHAPAAAATSISSYGISAVVGEVLAIAAIAAIMGALGGGFRKGGYTGEGDPDEVAGAVHRREFVFTEGQTSALGVPFLQDLAHAAGGIPRFETGGLVDNIPAWLTAREFVQPVASVDHYGVDFHEAVRNLTFPVRTAKAFAGGGMVGASSPSSSRSAAGTQPIKIVQVLNMRDAAREIEKDSDHKNFIVDVMKGSIHEVGWHSV